MSSQADGRNSACWLAAPWVGNSPVTPESSAPNPIKKGGVGVFLAVFFRGVKVTVRRFFSPPSPLDRPKPCRQLHCVLDRGHTGEHLLYHDTGVTW